MSDILTLHVKKEYFDQIKAGTKAEEYRIATRYWYRRLNGKTYDGIIVILAYPHHTKICSDNCICFPWNGCEMKKIIHKEFGTLPVTVYAIKLRKEELPKEYPR